MHKLNREDFDMIDEDNVDDYIDSMPRGMAEEIERYSRYPYYYGRIKSVTYGGVHKILFTTPDEVMICKDRNSDAVVYSLHNQRDKYQYLRSNDHVFIVERDGLRECMIRDYVSQSHVMYDYTESEE
jgi:hypothetical protein